jgi:phosphate transport system permease protein
VSDPGRDPGPLRPRRRLTANPAVGDRVFLSVARSQGTVVLLLMVLVGTFLLYRAWEALRRAGFGFLTTQSWDPDCGRFGIAAVIVGTVLIAVVAIVTAVPLAVGTALYISEYAPRRIRRTLIAVVDLMAAVPSVVYGLWGAFFLQ